MHNAPETVYEGAAEPFIGFIDGAQWPCYTSTQEGPIPTCCMSNSMPILIASLPYATSCSETELFTHVGSSLSYRTAPNFIAGMWKAVGYQSFSPCLHFTVQLDVSPYLLESRFQSEKYPKPNHPAASTPKKPKGFRTHCSKAHNLRSYGSGFKGCQHRCKKEVFFSLDGLHLHLDHKFCTWSLELQTLNPKP